MTNLTSGLLIQRDTRELITLSIDSAIARFYERTANIPNICHVHKLELNEDDLAEAQKITGIDIIRSTAIPIGTIWIGIVEKQEGGIPNDPIRGQDFKHLDF